MLHTHVYISSHAPHRQRQRHTHTHTHTHTHRTTQQHADRRHRLESWNNTSTWPSVENFTLKPFELEFFFPRNLGSTRRFPRDKSVALGKCFKMRVSACEARGGVLFPPGHYQKLSVYFATKELQLQGVFDTAQRGVPAPRSNQ